MSGYSLKSDIKLSSVCKKAEEMLSSAYRGGKIFTLLPKPDGSLSEFEILSVLALSEFHRKKVINKYIEGGKSFNITTSGILAWVMINIFDELNDDEKGEIEKYFTNVEEYFDKRTGTDGLLPAGPADNWIKSTERKGFLIEIQAYYAKIIDLLTLLTEDDMYEFKKKRLLRAVREKLNGAFVLDREDSLEIRPNTFIAAFFAPELFKRGVWQTTFDTSLKKDELWLDWGGLRLLSQSDINYNEAQDSKSWFFINNMSALVLARSDRVKYQQYIDMVLKSSSRNVLWQEHTGRPCEITLTPSGQIKVQGLYGLSLATFIYLYRLLTT